MTKYASFPGSGAAWCASLVVSVYCSTATVSALAKDGIYPFVSYTANYDSNVFGLSNESLYPLLTGRADGGDISQTLTAGVNLGSTLARQRLDLSAGLSRTRYSNFNTLDHDGRNIRGTWNWVLGNHLSGNIGASTLRSLTPLSNFSELARNLRTIRNANADGAWQFHPSWNVRGAVSRYTVAYDLESQRYGNIEEDRSEIGMNYLARSGSSVGLMLARVDGAYPDRARFTRVDESYSQDEARARVSWIVSGKTKVQLSAGWVSRHLSGARSAGYSGPGGRLTADWAVTGKTSLNASVWRELASSDDVVAPYSVNQGVSLAPAWRMSEKVTLQGALRYEKRDFEGGAAQLADTNRTASLTVSYSPLPSSLIQLSVFTTDREGTTPRSGFNRQGAAVNMQYEF